MHPKIAIITTEYLRHFVDKAFAHLFAASNYTVYTYSTFDELPAIYSSLPSDVKGVITSGYFPAQVIARTCPIGQHIIKSFNNDDAGLYQLFLQLLQNNRQLDFDRVYVDVLDIAGIPLKEYLFAAHMPAITPLQDDALVQIPLEQIMKAETAIGAMSLEELMHAEVMYTQKHLLLWKQGKIDVSITRFSSIMNRLQNEGLNAYFAFPSIAYLQSVYLATVQDIRIKDLQENQPAAIIVTPQNGVSKADTATRINQLHDALQRFNTVLQLDYLLQKTTVGFEIVTHRKEVEVITDGLSSCKLQEFMRKRLDFIVYVGYGLGDNLYQARINAVDANREASVTVASPSKLINDKDELITLCLQNNTPLVVSRKISTQVQNLAAVSGLSALTIQKVFSAARSMPHHQITSREMAHKLSISQRSANRFLHALKNAGRAMVVGQKQGITKGRPELLYQIIMTEEY